MLFSFFLNVFTVLSVVCNARVVMEPSVKVFSSNYWIKDNFIVSDLDTVYATFVLKHDHAATVHFEKDIMERSTPSAPTYGQWLSQEKIIHKIAPAPGAVQKVVDFIVSHGVSQDAVKVSTFRDVVRAAIPAQIAERMFETEFARFRSESQRNVNILRITRPYSLPEDIAPLVAIVDDILRFPAVEGPLMSFDAEPTDTTIYSMDGEAFTKCGEACNGYTTPAVVEKAYKMTTPTISAEANSGIAVTEFQREAGSASALGDFNKACGSGANAGESVRSVVTGGIGSTGPCSSLSCSEALMDVQFTSALVGPIPVTAWYVPSFSLLGWLDDLTSMKDPPLVASVSFSLDSSAQLSPEYMTAASTQFLKAAALGISLVFAAGDNGVWGFEGVGDGTRFHTQFPATSPFVTAVGATNFQTKSSVASESAWTCSGGGFSDQFAQPPWQRDAVGGYLRQYGAMGVLPPSNMFNGEGRAIPDVVVVGGQTNPFCTALGGGDAHSRDGHVAKFVGVSGTSGSASVFAAIVANLNNVRLNHGKPSLGLLTPLLYANTQCFHDVNDYSVNSCVQGSGFGFSAVKGWDPATGLGSPNAACLAAIVAA